MSKLGTSLRRAVHREDGVTTLFVAVAIIGLLSSTVMGSTETTFYVLAVYLGAVRIRDARHILPACLAGDLAGFAGAVAICHLFFG